MREGLAVVRGGGDLATGTVCRLARCGFGVVVLETPCPTVIRRTAAFASAVFDGEAAVEGLTAVKAASAGDCFAILRAGKIPVLVDPGCESLGEFDPEVLVDAIIAKRNLGTHTGMASAVIGLGPGFCAGRDVHAVVETNRGHNLGRVIWRGGAEPNTGTPGTVGGYTQQRLVRAPAPGVIGSAARIGDSVKKGQMIAQVDGVPVYAPLDGVLRGLIQPGLRVEQGMKIGDVDPRNKREYCFSVSDKARAIAGGVLEAALVLRNARLRGEQAGQ